MEVVLERFVPLDDDRSSRILGYRGGEIGHGTKNVLLLGSSARQFFSMIVTVGRKHSMLWRYIPVAVFDQPGLRS